MEIWKMENGKWKMKIGKMEKWKNGKLEFYKVGEKLPTAHCPLTPYALRLTPYALRLTPYALRLTPYALRLTPQLKLFI